MKYFSIFLFLLIITGCGGGGGSTSSITTTNGVFIDDLVVGLGYTCSSGKSSKTDKNGIFSCPNTDDVSFDVNGFFIGKTHMQEVVTPYTLWSDPTIAINVAQLLQTADADNANNTITIGNIRIDENITIDSPTFDSQINNLVAESTAQHNLNNNIVEEDKEYLTFEVFRGDPVNRQTNVVKNLNLISKGKYGSDINWSSSNTKYISDTGIVTTPSEDEGDQNVTLTATIYKYDVNTTKSFLVTVKYYDPDADNDYIPDDIEALLGMDTSSSDENHNGIIDGIDPDFGDPFYKYQWHIKSRGTVINNTNDVSTIVGNDLHLDSVYHQYMGYNSANPIIVSIVDDGVDADHEDLKDNIDLSISRNCKNNSNDPTPTNLNNTHGTMVAGIIASRGFNNIGVRGVAPFAKIAGFNWLENPTSDELENAWLNETKAQISSNSWGPITGYDDSTFYEDILKKGTANLRDGKGRIYVIAAGNERYNDGNSNLSNVDNNSYIISVAALNHKNQYASYSNPGSNILISGYGGEFYQTAPTIGTTTVEGEGNITWDEDTAKNYTYAMNGTSAATPTVSGCIALILEACPNLGYRDVKYILAKTAYRVDTSDSSWVKNAAGLYHSIDYGFGLINTMEAINMCKNNYTNLPQEKVITKSLDTDISIPDNDSNGITINIDIDQNITIEWIGIYPNIDHHYQGDLEFYLTSPSGTVTKLVQGNNILVNAKYYNGNGRLSSVAFMDEVSEGTWKLKIADVGYSDTGNLTNIKIEIKGH